MLRFGHARRPTPQGPARGRRARLVLRRGRVARRSPSPRISRQIATLEAEAGARLVERSARGVRLTQAGELLVGHADAILDRLTAAQSQLDALSSLEGGRLFIGAPPTANATLIPLAVRAFDEAYPEVHLRLDEAISSS